MTNPSALTNNVVLFAPGGLGSDMSAASLVQIKSRIRMTSCFLKSKESVLFVWEQNLECL